MKVTEENIRNLYKFTRQHFVEHYDVQTELVDHLANDIEQIWKEEPNLSFEEARDKSFKKFGVFGFMNIYEKKQQQLNKKYLKIIWKLLKEWFQLPKIILTLLSIGFFYYVYQVQTIGEYVFYSVQFIIVVFLLIKATILIRKQKARVKETGKNWLLEDIIFRMGSSNMIVLLWNVSFSFNIHGLLYDIRFVLLLSILSVLFLLITYITLVLIPKHSEKYLTEHYPEYKIAS